MKPVEKDHILQFFLEELRKKLGDRLKRVILFGSRARGNQHAHSDYDCLVVVEKSSTEISDIVNDVAGGALFNYSAVFSAFIVVESKLTQHRLNPFLRNVVREGIDLS